jgi:proline iminopeptidase
LPDTAFIVSRPGGVLVGHRRGDGSPALLLHGGPSVRDYTRGCAIELERVLETFRYTQRGAPPSLGLPPYSIESHMADTLAVLDYFQLYTHFGRPWLVGHSWGAHLALHLLVAHPERFLGAICIGALGAYRPFDELDANLRRDLTNPEIARVDEIEARRHAGEATQKELEERMQLLLPGYFADPRQASLLFTRSGDPEASRATNASIQEHFERGTLIEGLPSIRLPVLFVHGDRDPVPLDSISQTAALIPGASVVLIPDCGHFPWLERRAALRDAVEPWLQRLESSNGR